MEEVHLASFFTEPEMRSKELAEAVKTFPMKRSGELMAADAIVIGVPMYNFSISTPL